MHQRSQSPHDLMRKLNTDRSEHIPFSSRNSESNIFDFSIHKNKNASHIIVKKDKKPDNTKAETRKNSVSSYYFRNYNKNSKVTDTQSFSKYLKSKNQPSQATQQNQTRKRCVTTMNLTINKICSPFEPTNGKQKVTDLDIDSESFQNIEVYCRKHPSKLAYFESEQSSDCFCHQCSIECVKENNRLIQLSPQIQRVKKMIEKKVEETQKFGHQLCETIKQKISQNIEELQKNYNRIKMEIFASKFEEMSHREPIEFSLREIDWKLIEEGLKMGELSFLQPVENQYRIKKDNKVNEETHNITIHEFNQDFEMSPVPLISSIQKQRMDKVWKYDPKPKKNLMKQIENALNYQSRKTKHLKVKSICLKQDKSLLGVTENFNNQNLEPNIIRNDSFRANDSSKEMKRIAFGNFI